MVFVTGDIGAGDVTVFSFEVTNPIQPQESPAVSIESSGLIHLKQGTCLCARHVEILFIGIKPVREMEKGGRGGRGICEREKGGMGCGGVWGWGEKREGVIK